jgi:hypothetical protein
VGQIRAAAAAASTVAPNSDSAPNLHLEGPYNHLQRQDPTQGKAIRDDLRTGLDALPVWMRDLVTRLLQEPDQHHAQMRKSAVEGERSPRRA